MASKVNKEVWQLKVNGCLLYTSVCCYFTLRKKKERGATAVLYSCLLFRGQQRSGFDKAALISRPVFDQSWMFVFSLCVRLFSNPPALNGCGRFCGTSDSSRWVDWTFPENRAHSQTLHLDEPGCTAMHAISARRMGKWGGGLRWEGWGRRLTAPTLGFESDYCSLHSEQLVPAVRLSHGALGTATPQMFPFLRPKPTNQI